MQSARKVSDDERSAINRKIQELGPWFHNYEIASDLWTNPSGAFAGIEYPQQRWKLIEPLLPNVKGKSCLDVGCSSGFFSLKLKELGAAYVLGVDSGEQPNAIAQAKFAAQTLGLDADFRILSAYDLATLGRKFDIVLFMGVFYHLRHPLVGLDAVRAVSSGTMIFQTITTEHGTKSLKIDAGAVHDVRLHTETMLDKEFPLLRFVEGTLDGDFTCWFVPNIQAVTAMLRSSGFQVGEMTCTNAYDVIIRCSS